MMQIFVKKPQGDIIILNVESYETICSIKRKLKEQEGIRSDLHLGLMYNGKLLDDGRTFARCNILNETTLHLFLSQYTVLVNTWKLGVVTSSQKSFTLEVKSVNTIDDVKAKIQENEGIPQHEQLLFCLNEWLEDGSRTLADYDIGSYSTLYLVIQFHQDPQPNVTSQGNPLSPAKMSVPKLVPWRTKRVGRATQATPIKANHNSNGEAGDLMPEVSSLVLTELEGLKLKAETEQHGSYESQVVALEAENKNTEIELLIARAKVKELEATISELTHKNKVFSAQCASYESQVVALEAENRKSKAELMIADKGYAECLKEGKAKWLKSIEFLHHLTDASMQYFNYGFDSCQKQAEQQGFLGQLNKDSALKDAPVLKGPE